MKPDWKDAPEWATHLATDYNGTYMWILVPKPNGWGELQVEKFEYCFENARSLIEERPQ